MLRRIGSLGRLLAFFDFPLFDETFFSFADALKQRRCRLVIGVLRHELAVNGEVEYLLS